MGQFHNDFPGGSDVYAVESYFLAKKIYIDKLSTGEHHIRMKGIPNDVIKYYVKKDFDSDYMNLYEYLYNGEEFEFNLLAIRPSFKYKNNCVINNADMTRNIKVQK